MVPPVDTSDVDKRLAEFFETELAGQIDPYDIERVFDVKRLLATTNPVGIAVDNHVQLVSNLISLRTLANAGVKRAKAKLEAIASDVDATYRQTKGSRVTDTEAKTHLQGNPEVVEAKQRYEAWETLHSMLEAVNYLAVDRRAIIEAKLAS